MASFVWGPTHYTLRDRGCPLRRRPGRPREAVPELGPARHEPGALSPPRPLPADLLGHAGGARELEDLRGDPLELGAHQVGEPADLPLGEVAGPELQEVEERPRVGGDDQLGLEGVVEEVPGVLLMDALVPEEVVGPDGGPDGFQEG